MADNIDEENLNTPTENQLENLPDEIIPTADTETINSTQETENMEVHADHLHKAPGHGWKHYVYEFVMLFFAVFCGFLAEYQLEHTIEHQREKKYMQSMLHDLSRDTAAMTSHALFQSRAVVYADSLVRLLNGTDLISHNSDIYYYSRILSIYNPFFYSTASINQLKSSGSLRLIRNSSTADSILNYYDIYAQRIQAVEGNIEKEVLDFRGAMGGVINAEVIRLMIDTSKLMLKAPTSANFIVRPKGSPPLFSNERRDINQLCTIANFLLTLYQFQLTNLKTQKIRAITLMQLLKVEYALK